MTRELAQNILTEHIRLMSDIPLLKEDIKAFQMAISALEQEPCDTSMEQALLLEVIDKFLPTECEDAISREDALMIASSPTLSVNETVAMIKRLPSVTPSIKTEKLKAINKYCYDYGRQDGRNESRRKGHWIKTNSGYECSECAIESRSKSDFCQYCGADMRGAE